ncbi:amidohydrolase [Bauldia litoralis]|uniref:5-methylthioadenosine/S-adenosylhomocysteine deaminase n=1 Tax=Bauldia litoralis TaxID=665467 RepID=A0A1G6CUN7_9HYPH|nr:amidohydrolase [Bauldia litoralis]SDB36570.1 5-methylthioadenosine/S-adenosylhomocysteine deaminase [Bauldia litoralis]
MPILIKDAYLVPGAGRPHLPRADILVEGDRIAAIGRDLPAGDAETIDASDRIVLPGFVNAHTHSNESFEQGFYDALPLEVWLLHKYPPFAIKPLPERVHYLRTMLLAIESVRSGVTTVQDDLINRLGETEIFDGAAAAYRDIGLRAAITTSMSDRDMIEPLPWVDEMLAPSLRDELATIKAKPWPDHIALFERHFAKWDGTSDGRIRVILGPLGPQWCSDALMQATTEISLARRIPVHTHTLESKVHAVQGEMLYGKPIVEHLADIGVLNPNFTLNHAIWLTDRELDLIAERGCSVTHNPVSNLKLGAGIARVPEMIARGINIALGTDGTCTSDRADMLRSLATAAIVHRVGEMDYATWPTAEDAVRMATEGGARSALLHNETGTVTVGMKADLVLYDRSDYGFIPLKDAVAQLTYAVNSEAVRTVLVDGRVIMRERILTGIDEPAIKAEMKEEAERYLRDHVPAMEAAVKRFEPYWRQMQLRAGAETVPASTAPVRLPCGCHPGFAHTRTPFTAEWTG